MKRSEFLYLTGAFAFTAGCSTLAAPITRFGPDSRITFYNAHGHQNGNGEWEIPMRIYAYDRRNSVERLTTRMARGRYNLTPEEADRFRNRIRGLVADSESRQTVSFVFDNDPENEEFFLQNESGNRARTDANGIAEGKISLSSERAEQLMNLQRSDKGWLSFTAASGHRGSGRAQLIEPEGLSIISDIDDTIKVTEIPAGSRIVVRNTFFKAYTDAPGMQNMYQQWADTAAFHYVSGSPWQLYNSLSNFLIEETGFPEGTFHMKTVRKNLLNLNSWRDLRELATNELITYEQKISQIDHLMNTYPNRRYIFIGDSGEMDPEVYSTIREDHAEKIQEIVIRDVINARELQPERLEGMRVINARTVTPGVSQFG
ncbi:DUF2183 domain-containing protein [Rhodohalobacter sp. SW132]|uniref:phosphatidate phosphatase App1 family protein n=1 Tax=Rhodohalobacter sp. SW132 TaxID=2293433 RepID=UPI000E28071A|nr:App1 family protein [Rhodohalobacter sp. SW132]REL39174.1 DUF2183 domain-containing protein [Rhodohalobacter sp. SW132]